MGYVLRDCGEAYVRADNFAIVYDNKKLEINNLTKEYLWVNN